jgi:hypothetical protein
MMTDSKILSALQTGLHPRLPRQKSDRDAAGAIEARPHVLSVFQGRQPGPDCVSGLQTTSMVSLNAIAR